jgi:hypothetical protein
MTSATAGKMNDVELTAAIDALLTKAGAVSPPHSIVEAQEQGALLSRLAVLRDEARRRARVREAPSGIVSTGGRRPRTWIEHEPREAEIDSLLERLQETKQQAGANLLRQGRDPVGARVLLSSLRESFALRGVSASRFRKIIAACEQRGLVLVEGPFIEAVDGRDPARRGAGAAQLELAS